MGICCETKTNTLLLQSNWFIQHSAVALCFVVFCSNHKHVLMKEFYNGIKITLLNSDSFNF